MEIRIPIRDLIVKLRKEGQSIRNIAQNVKRAPSSVQYVLETYNSTRSIVSRHRSGRPRKLDSNQKRTVLRCVRADPRVSAPRLAAMVKEDYGVDVVPQTIRNVIKESGYNGRVARKKPYISDVNKLKRLTFAKAHVNKQEDFWNTVIFSDECKFSVFGSDGRQMVWRKANEQMKTKNLCPTVKHGGGSVMVWGCMSAAGVGNLVFIDGIMDWKEYLNILKNNLHASAEKLNMKESFIFQQDNDPKHTAMNVKLWLLYKTKKQLHTPPQSPDMNPIEHLWDEMKRRLKNHRIRSKQQLRAKIVEEWGKIQIETTKKLVQTMPKRMREIIRNKGDPTDH